ncbi:chitin synthase-domain-containing protein [Limtongia smithiae]|uniref:chitin synthase-domain-containing protein n=1 Tax=Limtongia smithiae TaxID=1125753 RepID=UPI0034CDB16C
MELPLSFTLAQQTPNALLAALRNAYEAGRSVRITSTSLVLFDRVSELETESPYETETDDSEEAVLRSIWEHARRRAEDQTLLLLSAQPRSAPALSNLSHLLPAFPNIPGHVFSALSALAPFLPLARTRTAVAVELSLSLSGQVLATRIKLSDEADKSGDKTNFANVPLLKYILASARDVEKENLSLRSDLTTYSLLDSPLPDPSDELKTKAFEWRQALLECGLEGTDTLHGIFAIISGILLFANTSQDDILEGATLLGIDPEKVDSDAILSDSFRRENIITSAYKSLLLIMTQALNQYLSSIDYIQGAPDSDDVCAIVSVLDAPNAYRTMALQPIFATDNVAESIALEMATDGISIPETPVWIRQSLQQDLSAPDLIDVSSSTIDITAITDPTSQLANTPKSSSLVLSSLLSSSRLWHIIGIPICDSKATSNSLALLPANDWSNGVVSAQIRSWFLLNWLQKYRTIDFTADFGVDEFLDRYADLLQVNGIDVRNPYGIDMWAQSQRGWGADGFFHGRERIWLREDVWRTLEGELDGLRFTTEARIQERAQESAELSHMHSIPTRFGTDTPASRAYLLHPDDDAEDLTMFGSKFAANDPEAQGRKIETREITRSRKTWINFVWALSFWIPSAALRFIGRMKRPDVRIAWREKFVICLMIFFMNAALIFYMIFLSDVLCPDYDRVWNGEEVSEHTASDDFYVSIHGKVYDISKFWKLQHSDNDVDTTTATMEVFAGLDLSNYFPPPLTVVCSDFVTDDTIWLSYNTTITYSSAEHACGPDKQSSNTTALYDITWYNDKFLPRIKEYYKGELVTMKSYVEYAGQSGYNNWAIIDNKIYDLTNYFYTTDLYPSSDSDYYAEYDFLDSDVTALFTDYPGEDITEKFYALTSISDATRTATLNCLNSAFYAGEPDFRKSARCQASNYILLGIACILGLVILVKFVSSLQLGSKQNPQQQDKFVICQIPAYTEGEEQLRNAIDSLTAMQYDDNRKLLFVICDGMIVGSGNDKPTPEIVLDILGADPRLDPPACAFESVGEGSQKLNYGKVYSGLYEFEGHVVPYIVVVKVGKESEKSRPGNRGKRDSQCLLLDFLNHVHFRAPMSPLQLEIFHQLNNVIGVDPELYEFLFMVDADTSVAPDSLNRLVAACVRDSRIVGIAGETSLQNEQGSLWTMIQVYEYYISHYLSKSFESLFGSVTCLPGCFCMYRLRTADKAKPLIISKEIITGYSDGQIDTLHKKNLLALGEDRYLTTLMMKSFPKMRFTFVPDAHAQTAAPDTWGVLISQRRRWINSTIHNLAELVLLPDLCGFCIFSMRFVVMVDLIGTLLLPSVLAYIVYLLYLIISGSGSFPLISVIMIGAVYGLQALVFIIRRQWQHVGWMIIYVLAYPVYSFILPVYSFWNQDNFSWGNTRIAVGESGSKQIYAVEDDYFDPKSVPLQTWEEYAVRHNLPGQYRPNIQAANEKGAAKTDVMYTNPTLEEAYEMDDLPSMYSSYRPVSAYSGLHGNYDLPPAAWSVYGQQPQASVYSGRPVSMAMTEPELTGVMPGQSRPASMMSGYGSQMGQTRPVSMMSGYAPPRYGR